MADDREDRAAAPPFFVVGSGRSGTTMLRLMLDAHPEVAVPPESHFVDGLVRRWGELAPNGRMDPRAVVRFAARRLEKMRIPLEEAEQRLATLAKGGDPVPPAVAVDALFRIYAEGNGKTRWGDKTPGYVLDMPLLARTFREARFVHMIRDGRDVALSYLSQNFGPRNVPEAARFWDDRVRTGRRHGDRLGPQRYRELRYEDLVAEPEPVLRSLCAFLDLTFEPQMLAFHEEAKGQLTERLGRWRGLYQPVRSGMRDWTTEMADRDVEVFEAIAGDMLSDLGYERKHPSPSTAARARAFVAMRRRDAHAAWLWVVHHMPSPLRRARAEARRRRLKPGQ